jgi:hypothetical protein
VRGSFRSGSIGPLKDRFRVAALDTRTPRRWPQIASFGGLVKSRIRARIRRNINDFTGLTVNDVFGEIGFVRYIFANLASSVVPGIDRRIRSVRAHPIADWLAGNRLCTPIQRPTGFIRPRKIDILARSRSSFHLSPRLVPSTLIPLRLGLL